MSHTPLEGDDLEEIGDPESEYSKHWEEMSDRLLKGGSLSGRERNCAFLNLDGSRFATVSKLSGFDFPDDSRSLALVDWDVDGRMDVWFSNRSAPRVRFLKNELQSPGSWIQVGLEEDRLIDPIGARVEVTLADGKKLLRSLRAGEGFLGQSSRFLHFGLGGQEAISLRVRWPDGVWQSLEMPSVNARYEIHRKDGKLKKVGGTQQGTFEEGGLTAYKEDEPSWIRLPIAVPFPPLFAKQGDGSLGMVPLSTEDYTLINLWDPECQECVEELLDWKENLEHFPKNLKVVTLLTNPALSQDAGRAFIEEHKLPFSWAKLDPSSAQLLAQYLSKLFRTSDQFAAPASFLVDREGNLVSFSIGKVEAENVISEVADASKMAAAKESLLEWAYGNQGEWLGAEDKLNLLFVPRFLMSQGQVDAAAHYVCQAYSHLSVHRDIDLMLVWIGDNYFKSNQPAEGVKFYLNALKNGTKDPIVMNNVAWQLATHRDQATRDGATAVKWAEKAVVETKGQQATYYDTLAAAYAEVGRFEEALRAVATGLSLASKTGEQSLIPGFLKARELYERKEPFRAN
ncbi:ASPIC/UnbV domain-containing protein [Akkermansiaceae bacterium]|nr:ASPIC/UnbV domain-containing protein [Akkermansiaceae bacterium]